jgi:hypothetical protein
VIASSLQSAPWLTAIGRHKGSVFGAVGVMLAFNYWMAIVRPRRMRCDPGEICHVDSPAMRVSRAMFWASVAIWFGAVLFTYTALWWVRLQS